MLSVKSITFDGDEIGQVLVPESENAVRASADDDFISRLRAGDESAFSLLVERYAGDVYAVLYRLTEDPEEAADLTQDTFFKALKAIKGFRGDSELKTWLIRIAINESRNRFRWWKRRRRDATISLDALIGDSEMTVSQVVPDRSMSPEETAIARERESALRTAIADLPSMYRETVVLCDIEGLSYEETAVVLGCSIGTVKSRLSRGREQLRRRLWDL